MRSTDAAMSERRGSARTARGQSRTCPDQHTAATLLLQQGVAPRVAMQMPGHSQISMTMHYTHVVPELARDAAARMGEALWGEAQ